MTINQSAPTVTSRVRLSVRIPYDLFERMELRRFELSRAAGRRVSSRALLEAALSRYLAEAAS